MACIPGGMFLLSVKMTSSSILEMQRCEWPENLNKMHMLVGLQEEDYSMAVISIPDVNQDGERK
jgi:hypothetical protein